MCDKTVIMYFVVETLLIFLFCSTRQLYVYNYTIVATM